MTYEKRGVILIFFFLQFVKWLKIIKCPNYTKSQNKNKPMV